MTVIQIKSLTEFKTAISKNKLVLVDFYTDWCKYCVIAAPEIEKLSQKYTQTDFYKVNCETCPDIGQACRITGYPTFGFYKNGQQVGVVSGGGDAAIAQIEQFIVNNGGAFNAFGGSGKTLGGGSGKAGQVYVNPYADEKSKSVTDNKESEKNNDDDNDDGGDDDDDIDPAVLEKAMKMSKEQSAIKTVEKVKAAMKQEKETSAETNVDNQQGDDEEKKEINQEEAMEALKKSMNQEYLAELIQLGFTELRSLKALINTSNQSVEAAANWIFDHSDDKDIDDPIEFNVETPEEKQKRLEEKKKMAKLLQQEQRKKMEEMEKKNELEREKKRIQQGRAAMEASESYKELAAQKEKEEIKRQKMEAKKEKMRLKKLLEEDKLRRKLERLRREGDLEGVAEIEKKLGITPSTSSSSSSEKQQQQQQDQEKKEEECVLQIRLLDGSTSRATFKPKDTLKTVYAHTQMLQPGANFVLMTNFPRKLFKGSELNRTLEETGLSPRGALICTTGA